MYHEATKAHKSAVLALRRFGQEPRIDLQLSQARAEEIRRHNDLVRKNRSITRSLIDCVIFLGTHELPFRGRHEGRDSSNRGNFKDLLSFLATRDAVLQEHLDNSTVFRGDSQRIQNDLILCISEEVRDVIRSEIQRARFIALQVDDTTDITQQSQCSIIVRYVLDNEPVERFLTFRNVSQDASAEGLTAVVLDELKVILQPKEGGPPNYEKLVAQTYDGAAVMSGKLSGVQKRIRGTCRNALFVHCYAHKLNLVLRNAVVTLTECKIFFSTLDGINSFFRTSPKRLAAFQSTSGKPVTFTTPSDTRWTYRARVLSNVLRDYKLLVTFFRQVKDDRAQWDGATFSSANGYFHLLMDLEFTFQLVVLQQIFQICSVLFEQMQSVQVDMCSVKRRLQATSDQLDTLRLPDEFERMFTEARKLQESAEFQDEELHPKRKKRNKEGYNTLYFKILDKFHEHFRLRFCDLPSLDFLPIANVSKVATYRDSFPQESFGALFRSPYCSLFKQQELKDELENLYGDDVLVSDKPSLSSILIRISEQQIQCCYSQAVVLLELILTIPISSASCERSFSCLKRVKTFLRNTMGDDRLRNLALLSIEKQLCKTLDRDRVIDRFAAKDRRIELHFK